MVRRHCSCTTRIGHWLCTLLTPPLQWTARIDRGFFTSLSHCLLWNSWISLAFIHYQPRCTHVFFCICACCKRRHPMACGFYKAFTYGREMWISGKGFLPKVCGISQGLHASFKGRRRWSCPICNNVTCAHMENDVCRCQVTSSKASTH